MKLTAINALRNMGRDELEATAQLVGVELLYGPLTPAHGWTRDRLRLAIIDAVCDAELAARRVAEVEDHDEPCDCGHGVERHEAVAVAGLEAPVYTRCTVDGCDCQQYMLDEAEAMR